MYKPFSLRPAFNVTQLFMGGYEGAVYNAAFPGSLWQDTAATTPADEVGEPIGRENSLILPAINATQGTASAKPTLGNIPRGGRRNRATNNQATGVSAPVTFPTDWAVTVTNPELTATMVDSGTVEGIKYWDLRIQGTVTSSRDCDLRMNPITAAPAATGQAWVQSCYLQQVGGSQTNVSFIALQANTYTSGSAYVNTPWADTNEGITTAALSTQRKSRGATLSGATIAYICPFMKIRTAASGAVDLTLRIGEYQIEPGSTPSNIQKVSAVYDVTEDGIPTIPMAYGDSGDWFTTGVEEFGTASFFAEAGQSWWAAFVISSFVIANQNILAKAGATLGDRTLQITGRNDNFFVVTLRGEVTVSTHSYADGLLHVGLLEWDGAAATLYIDEHAGEPCLVGTAAEEAEVITIATRTASSPAANVHGFFAIPGFGDRALSATERASLRANLSATFRGV